MTKPESGLFKGTSGTDDFYGNAEKVIAERVKGLDLTPHTITQKQLSAKQKQKIKGKIEARIATREEYAHYEWSKRLDQRRKAGVDEFWKAEKGLLKSGNQPTRNWNTEQKQAILSDKKPTFNNQTLQSHHTYSVSQFPHLANVGGVIYPATTKEHLKGWHGGNYKKSKAGRRIRRIREF